MRRTGNTWNGVLFYYYFLQTGNVTIGKDEVRLEFYCDYIHVKVKIKNRATKHHSLSPHTLSANNSSHLKPTSSNSTCKVPQTATNKKSSTTKNSEPNLCNNNNKDSEQKQSKANLKDDSREIINELGSDERLQLQGEIEDFEVNFNFKDLVRQVIISYFLFLISQN